MSEWTNREDRQRDAAAQYEHIMTTPAPPVMGAYIDAGVVGFVFGEMWRRGVLTARDRRWVTLACVGAGELLQAEGWLARCAERAMQPEDVRRSNHTTAREVGLPVMRGLLALAKGDPDAAVQQLHAVRPQLRRLGGSHLQRDLLDQTLMAAAAQARHAPIGRALLNERLMAKPVVTPLTRHWADRLHLQI